jgi:hypothetical protein
VKAYPNELNQSPGLFFLRDGVGEANLVKDSAGAMAAQQTTGLRVDVILDQWRAFWQ